MKARIITGAAKTFIAKNLKPCSCLTREQRSYVDNMMSLENAILNVRHTYDNRIVLECPHEIMKDGRTIVGIDIEAEYVEIVEQ